MSGTNIEWCDETWNPIVGCTPVSEGCKNCYAAPMAHRLEAMEEFTQYAGLTGENGKWTGKVSIAPERVWKKPFGWRKPRRIFVCSMGDLFHDAVPAARVGHVMDTAAMCPQHTFLLLSKRPARMRRLMANRAESRGVLPNVWLGVTAENQEWANERIPLLLDTPAAVRFVSCEPMLGPIDLAMAGLDWVICGGETGRDARPMDPEWARSLRDQCAAADVPFFFKKHSPGGRQSLSPVLDGREHRAFPQLSTSEATYVEA